MIDIVLILVVIVAVVIGTSSKENSYMRFYVAMLIGIMLCLVLTAFVVLGYVGGMSPVVHVIGGVL